MKERGIIFSGDSPKLILAGIKTQTRRIMKPQPNAEHEKVAKCYSLTLGRTCHESQGYAMFQDEDEIGYEIRCPYGVAGDRLWCRTNHYIVGAPVGLVLYGLTDDRIYCSHSLHGRTNYSVEWHPSQADPDFTKQGLHGRVRWPDLLTNEIRRLWQEGIRGLVSAKGASGSEQIPSYLDVPREHQSDEIGSSLGLHGFSWDSCFVIDAGKALRWKPDKQPPGESHLGEPRGELAGSKGSWSRERGRKTSDGEAQRLGSQRAAVGHQQGTDEPKTSGQSLGHVAGWNLRHHAPKLKLRPSIHMPRWASRITLEILEVRVERLQDITYADALREGVKDTALFSVPNAIANYMVLWDSLHGKGAWEQNPWVWVLEFRKL